MDTTSLKILINIIGGVESGGQIYGNRRYGAYAAAGANSSNEVTCTLGWAQNYGYNARALCQRIFERDPEGFRKADTAGIEQQLKKDWVSLRWNPSSKQRAALIAIITTDTGKQVQDDMFLEQAQKYIAHAEEFGVTDTAAQMMWCEIEHLGGLEPTKRIFGRAAKPYTPDSIYASLLLDQKDKSNNNQVGDKIYQSRHQCCVLWIKEYVKTDTKNQNRKTAEKLLDVLRSWVGYGRSNGKQRIIIDIYNQDDPAHLPRGYKVNYSDSYCDVTVSAAAIKSGMKDLLGKECGVEEHVKIFKSMGIWNEDGTITPKAGYPIVYSWRKAVQPNDSYSDHIGVVESVKNGTIVVIEGNYGGEVKRRTIPVGWGYIRGYAVPKYESSAGQESGKSNNGGTTESGSTTLSRTPKWVGEVTASKLNVRKWAGTEYSTIKSWPLLAKGNLVDVCDTVYNSQNEPWYFVRIDARIYGFVKASYIRKK